MAGALLAAAVIVIAVRSGLADAQIFTRMPVCSEPTGSWPSCSTNYARLGNSYGQFWAERCSIEHHHTHHTGLDLAQSGSGASYVVAALAGTVIAKCPGGVPGGCPGFSNNSSNNGLDGVVILWHDLPEGTLYTLYGHMTSQSVNDLTPAQGLSVAAGQRLGTTCTNGCSGLNHVHFEVKNNPVLKNSGGSCRDPSPSCPTVTS